MRILVVEDDIKIAKAIKTGLEQEAFAVDIIHDGEQGFDLASTEPYDVIILDWMLPSKDGLAICQELRGMNIATPVLFLTAKGQVDDKVVGLNTGADDYLAKPFSFAELIARVQALLRRPQQVVGQTLQANDLAIDPLAKTVTRHGVDVQLTGKEYALLHYLVVNKGRVIDKQELLDHVWDFDSDVLLNTVEVYIGALRKKIDLPFPQLPPLIQTLRGHGYKIN